MARLFSNRERPYDMGVLATELLARDASTPIVNSRMPADASEPHMNSIAPALREHLEFCAKHLEGEVAPAKAPVPDDPHAFVFLVEFGREPKPGEPGAEWIRGTNALRTDVRCAEVAVVLAGYLRAPGWEARGHVAGASLIKIEHLAQRAGVAQDVNGILKAPLLARGFRLGVVTTTYAMSSDRPLPPDQRQRLGLGAA